MRPNTTPALALLFPLLLALALLVVACSGEETMVTAQAASSTTQAMVTTTEAPASAPARNADRQSKLDEFIRQLDDNNKLMGGVVITQDGQVMYEDYIGFASVPDQVPNSQQTEFRIGSITKMFTATMVMQLVEEGRLTLDTKLASFYPQIGNADKITISEMLSHRSGIHDFTQDPELEQYTYTNQSKEAMVARIASMAPDFEPDEQFSYSNSNYVLLGYIIEDITNSTYQQELETRITRKLGLMNTGYGTAVGSEEDEATSYTWQDGSWIWQRPTDMSVPAGAGAIVSTPRDLTTFITALFGGELVNEASLNQMLDMRDGYGKGIAQGPGELVSYGHGGQIDAFSSILAYFPDEKVAAALLANGVDGSLDDVMSGITRIYFNLPFEIPDFTPLPTPTVAGTLAFANVPRGGVGDIYVVNADGTGLRQVTETLDWEEEPSWSPDGGRIVYAAFAPGDSDVSLGEVWIVNADGSGRAQLSEGKGFNPAWSPDGKQIVYVAVAGEGALPIDILVMKADGSDARVLTSTEGLPVAPSWTPTGEILFLRSGDLYSIERDGSGLIRLTTGKNIGEYALSPDGSTLAYCDANKMAIVADPLRGDGSAVTLLAPVMQFVQNDPTAALSWTPDGKAVAIASASLNGLHGSPLYIVNADGSGLSQIPGVDLGWDPAWRPQ